jgi:hypothetical protein
MNFAQADQRYNELKQEYLAGSLSSEAFDEALREMMIQDDQERWWAKGREAGEWHYYDEDKDEWIRADPPGYQAPTAPPPPEPIFAQAQQPLQGVALETTAREQPELSPKPESATAVPSAPADRAYRSRVRGQPRQGRIWVLIGVVAVALLGVGLGVYTLLSRSGPPATPEEVVQVPAGTYTVERVSGGRDDEPAQTVEVAPTLSPTETTSVTPTEMPTTIVMPAPTVMPSPTATPVLPLPSAQGMVEINIGTYTTTVPIADELPAFWIDQYEVTNIQYARFIEETDKEPPDYWLDENIPEEKGDHPVEGISWQLADEYCHWLNKRLPTEAEWQVAGRGPHGWVYPWGNDGNAVQLPAGGTYAVGSILANRSFFGVFDMAGNVWEWVAEPYLQPGSVEEGQRLMHGGSATYPADLKTPLAGDPDSSTMKRNAGIRCAADQVALEGDDLAQVADGNQRLTLLYSDDFANVSPDWPQVREKVGTYFYGYHPPDYYHVQVDGANDCLSVPRELDFLPADYMLEVEAFVFRPLSEAEGDFEYGVIVRQTSRNEFYAFVISSRTQHWEVLKSSPEGMAVMAEGNSSSIRGDVEGTRDKLFVIAKGPRLTFFLNGQLVADLSDNDYAAGHAGLITETFDNMKAHVHNDTFVLWDVPPGAVTSEGATMATADLVYDRALCRGYFSDAELLLNFTAHTVQPGENLTVISQQYGTTIEAILKANDIADKNRIRSGWSLVIPLPAPEESTG